MAKTKSHKTNRKKSGKKNVPKTGRDRPVEQSAATSILSGPMKNTFREAYLRHL